MAAPFLPCYLEKLSDFDRSRYLKKVEECGEDPYSLSFEDLSVDRALWPKVDDFDRFEYFILKTNFTNKECMKNFKALEAYNFVISGLVELPRCKELPGDRVLLLGKVGHSQRRSEPPLRLWVLAEKAGRILLSHCNCMAGRSETCSHVAALVYLLQYHHKADESLTCTDKLSGWLPPATHAAPQKAIKEINFSSASTRAHRLEAAITSDGAQPRRIARPRRHSVCAPSPVVQKEWIAEISQLCPSSAVLGLYSDFCKPYKTAKSTPLDLTRLHDPSTEEKSFVDVLSNCDSIFKTMTITANEVKTIEAKTRKQRECVSWFIYRCGRITSTGMVRVKRGDAHNPCKSTVNMICKPGRVIRDISSLPQDLHRGIVNEEAARKAFVEVTKADHTNLAVETKGLIISQEKPFLATSPDGIIVCDCCPGYGVLEIKCPRPENLGKCLDAEGNILKTHEYYTQIQHHLLVTGASYACLFMWTVSSGSRMAKVYPDLPFQQALVEKATHYFKTVVLPELVSKWYTRNVFTPDSAIMPPPPSPLQETSRNTGNVILIQQNAQKTVPDICFCRRPRYEPVVLCAGTNSGCLKEFHARCVDLRGATKKKWFCGTCHPSSVARKKRRSVSVCDENIFQS